MIEGNKMRKEKIKQHLKDYKIYNKRKSTIINAFASALALYKEYDEEIMTKALQMLGQDPNENLRCFYCDKTATTFDHIYGIVKDKKYAGYGHEIGNLIPCCQSCNSSKRNTDWREFLKKNPEKIKILENYIRTFLPQKNDEDWINDLFPEKMKEYNELKEQILELMKKADDLASQIKKEIQNKSKF